MSAEPQRDDYRERLAEFERLLGTLHFDDVAEALHRDLAARVRGGVNFGQHFGDFYTLLEALVVYRKARVDELRANEQVAP